MRSSAGRSVDVGAAVGRGEVAEQVVGANVDGHVGDVVGRGEGDRLLELTAMKQRS